MKFGLICTKAVLLVVAFSLTNTVFGSEGNTITKPKNWVLPAVGTSLGLLYPKARGSFQRALINTQQRIGITTNFQQPKEVVQKAQAWSGLTAKAGFGLGWVANLFAFNRKA